MICRPRLPKVMTHVGFWLAMSVWSVLGWQLGEHFFFGGDFTVFATYQECEQPLNNRCSPVYRLREKDGDEHVETLRSFLGEVAVGSQTLAAAGYAVLQPEFRGSAGFGRKFEQAGYRQWGLAMQDDITAGVKAMIARGVADPDRICIYGASYGGYAALWGLVKTPEPYRCGVSLAGVTDIGELFSDWSDTNSSPVGREWMRFAVGDLNTMRAQFDAVSPEKHAGQIHVPVLLAHGVDDERVPIGHSKRMASALKAAHGSVETHWYDGEKHGLTTISDIRDFEATLLDFLDRNIGPSSGNAAKEAATAPASSTASATTP